VTHLSLVYHIVVRVNTLKAREASTIN